MTWDPVTDKRILSLHPKIRDNAFNAVNELAISDIYVRCTDGKRSIKYQEELYNQPFDGRDNDHDGRIDEPDEKVTTVLISPHLFGLAGDFVEIVNGRPMYVSNNYLRVGLIFEKHGFTWGGRWLSQHQRQYNTVSEQNYLKQTGQGWDRPHVEMLFGFSYKKLWEMQKSGNVDSNGYIIL